VLAAVEALPIPQRPEDYGARTWQRLQPRLALEASPPSWWDRVFGGTFSVGRRNWALGAASAAVLAAAIVAAFLAGRHWPTPPAQIAQQPLSGQVRERILLVAVGDHLERSQMVLAELVNANAKDTSDISSERQHAGDLVEANRLYRQTAARAGEAAMAGVLDDLERILLEIAHSPATISSTELAQIQHRIEAQGILFKVRVIGSQVREREKVAPPAAERKSS
jgi:hypothetical protein